MKSLSFGVCFLSLAATLSAQTVKFDGNGALETFYIAPKTTIAHVEDRHERRNRNIWITSMIAVVAATAADAATSWGKGEANGILASRNGTFGGRGVAIKAGLAGALILPQVILRHHKQLRTTFTVINFVQAGVYTGVAVHNSRIE